ncbi:hypothetical protein MHM98_01345 [Psychrobium sp. MM17-31]|uniref:hypothetical protein n=1 Tax=Psychrobium sp. MM17-31 TaxID=2917758 RepID=UPI001EF3EB49|nr:hypothetical protein [Psychrobium sp. MM17-31]MCG7530007.1 hypothetical protein [Psychrobium sp. MM17-31]
MKVLIALGILFFTQVTLSSEIKTTDSYSYINIENSVVNGSKDIIKLKKFRYGWGIESYDVVESIEVCSTELIFCFRAEALQFAIPKIPPKINAVWEKEDIRYKTKEKTFLKILGVDIEVFVIESTQKDSLSSSLSNEFLYSYDHGLMGFITNSHNQLSRRLYISTSSNGFLFPQKE